MADPNPIPLSETVAEVPAKGPSAEVPSAGVPYDSRLAELEARLGQAEEMIRAIHYGQVDALVVNGPQGPRVYTLEGADHPYRMLVEEMHEGTVTLDRDGLILYSNPQFLEMVGANFVTGSRFAEHVAREDQIGFEGLMETAAARNYSSGEITLRGMDGRIVPVRLSLTSLDVADVRAISVLVTDRREELRNEAILKEEQLSRLILEQAGEAILVIDPQGTIVRESESAKALAKQTVMLTHFDRTFSLESAGEPLTAERIRVAVSAGQPVRGVEALMRDGTTAVLVSASPLWSPAKEMLGCVVTLTDITERKRAEDALARQAEELARSNSDLRQFAYSASHDLREPVRQLAVFSEMLERKYQSALGEEGSYLIQHAIDSAHRIEKLLNDLLAYIHSADAPREVLAPVDTGEIVRRTVATFEMQIEQTGARVEYGPLPKVVVHEVHLVQLTQNLVGNALKYRGDAVPLIRIGAERAGGMWKFSVEDNGIGIRPEYQGQIFGLFQRLHGGARYAGSGIGLAICQKIVQRYGGRIWVESEPGRGSKFMFTVPGEKG